MIETTAKADEIKQAQQDVDQDEDDDHNGQLNINEIVAADSESDN